MNGHTKNNTIINRTQKKTKKLKIYKYRKKLGIFSFILSKLFLFLIVVLAFK
jgi:heme/copper-type cytochrome/quinol oxidase subunit 3